MGYGKVQETFWHDPLLRGASERARHFFLYLLTSPHRNRLGCYVLDERYAAADVQWDAADVQAARDELERLERIRWDPVHRVVFLVRWFRHNTLENTNVVKGGLADLRALPPTPLLADLLEEVNRHVREDVERAKRKRFNPLLEELQVRSSRSGSSFPQNAPNSPQSYPQYDRRGRVEETDEKGEVENPPGAAHEKGSNGSETVTPTVPATVTPTVSDSVTSSLAFSRPSPDQQIKDPPNPPPNGDTATAGEDDEATPPDVRRWLPLARSAIVEIHGGTEDPVTIEGHEVGLGIDVDRFKRLASQLPEGPEVVARAIRHLPAVTGLRPPVSLARWLTPKDGAAVLNQCLHRALQETPSQGNGPKVEVADVPRDTPQAERLRARRAELRAQLEQVKARELHD